jgi:hypothetical protein
MRLHLPGSITDQIESVDGPIKGRTVGQQRPRRSSSFAAIAIISTVRSPPSLSCRVTRLRAQGRNVRVEGNRVSRTFAQPVELALVPDPAFSAWLENVRPAWRWGRVEERVGAGVIVSSAASSFVNGHTLYVDSGITASL